MNRYPSIRSTIFLSSSLIALLGIFGSMGVEASNEFQVLQTLSKQEGRPRGTLIKDSASNLYNTIFYSCSNGSGTVFKLDASENVGILHEFHEGDGSFYGTTLYGGSNERGFKFEPSWNLNIINSQSLISSTYIKTGVKHELF